MRPETTVATQDMTPDAPASSRELRQSLFLLSFLVATVGSYLALGFLAVRVLGS